MLIFADRSTRALRGADVFAVASQNASATNDHELVLSGDGSTVVFTTSSQLALADTNAQDDIYAYDTATHALTLITLGVSGVPTDGPSGAPVVTPDGRYVAFVSQATNLVAADTNGFADVFVYDRNTGTTTRVSVASNGAQGAGASNESTGIIASGFRTQPPPSSR